MEKTEILAFRDAKPFVPFVIRLADGRVLRIPDPDYIMVSPTGKFALAFLPNGGHVNFELSCAVDIAPQRDDLFSLYAIPDA